MDDIGQVMAMIDAGGEDVLTEEERALLPPEPEKSNAFNANLAETLDESVLNNIAMKVIEAYDADVESRADWVKREAAGIRLTGISERDVMPPAFEGGSTAIHPGLIEAVIQFQARAIAELWPAGGPAKALVEGETLAPDREAQADRVAKYLNWLYTTKMPGGYQHHEKMLFRLPLSGSTFKKLQWDPSLGTLVSRFVPADELIVPYGCSDLISVPRITHAISYSGYDLRRLIEGGAYRKIELNRLAVDDQASDLQPELDAVTGTKPSSTRIDDSDRYTCLEQCINLDIEGEPDNSPYLVTVVRDSQETLAIYRYWRKGNATRQRRRQFVHYPFFPGLDGFYGLGLLHIIGRLSESASGSIRALLDAALLANMKGGFRSADVRLPKGNRGDGIKVTPGEWPAVEATTDELQKLFVTLPYGEPSQTLFNLMNSLDEWTRRVSGTTEELVGETTKNVPVGTTLARIEQGLKVHTAIQLRLHQAMAEELQLMCELIAEHGPDADYCRDVLGVTPEQFAADFDGRVDVRPVSDPNAITSTQRMIIAQALVDLAKESGGIIDPRVAYRRLLETMRVQGIEELMPDPAQVERMGPVEENMAMTIGRPVKAQPDQDHQAHIVVHQQWLATIPDPELQKNMQGPAMAHMAEHFAWSYHLKMQQMMGMQLPAAPLGAGQSLPPEQENMLAMMAAQAVQLMANQQQPNPIDQATIQAASKAQADQEKAAAEIRRKDALAAATIQRDDASAIARMNRDVAEQEARLVSKYLSDQANQALGNTPMETVQ